MNANVVILYKIYASTVKPHKLHNQAQNVFENDITGRSSMIFAYIKMAVFMYKNLYGFLNGELLNNTKGQIAE